MPAGITAGTLVNAPNVQDLAQNSTALQKIWKDYNANTLRDDTTIRTVAGTQPTLAAGLSGGLSPLFGVQPFDGLIGLYGAHGLGSGLKNRKQVGTYPLNHTGLQCDDQVIADVASKLTPPPAEPPPTEPPPPPTGTPPPPVITAFTLSVSTGGTGSGTVSAVPPGPTYSAGTVVTLTATPDVGSTFTAWSGDADCLDGVVTIDANKICTATFTRSARKPRALHGDEWLPVAKRRRQV